MATISALINTIKGTLDISILVITNGIHTLDLINYSVGRLFGIMSLVIGIILYGIALF
jgi:hypothetical protein